MAVSGVSLSGVKYLQGTLPGAELGPRVGTVSLLGTSFPVHLGEMLMNMLWNRHRVYNQLKVRCLSMRNFTCELLPRHLEGSRICLLVKAYWLPKKTLSYKDVFPFLRSFVWWHLLSP
jgi:hypothetical protein